MNNKSIEILLIEDSEYDAEMTVRALKKNRIANNIVRLENGRIAIDFLGCTGEYINREQGLLPNLILLDLKMPLVDGLEVLQFIKSHAQMKKVPVVILTSSKEHPDIQKCYELGANSYLVKPVQFNAFMDCVAQAGIYWMLLNQPPD